MTLAACSPHYDDDTALRNVSNEAVVYDGEPTRIVGRHVTQADGSELLSWAGTQVHTRFTGDSITVGLRLKNGQKQNFLQIILDGDDSQQLTIDSNTTTYTIAATAAVPADANGAIIHELSLVKLNEPMDGTIYFQGFTPAAGGALQPTKRPSGRRLLYIGDSITCGYGNLGTITTLALTSSTDKTQNSLRDCNYFLQKKVYQVSSAYEAFGTQAARNLDAEWQLISWSGRGIYRNADGTTNDTIPDIWQRADASDGNTQYTPDEFVPQAVVINLGTNDFGSIAQSQTPQGGPPNIPLFRSRYVTLVKQVRKAFPNAWILVATGPMLSDYYPTTFKALSTMRTTLHSVIDDVGDRRVQFFEFPLNITSDIDATGCEWHPDAAQDATMATRLEGAIKKYLLWQ